MRTLDDAIDVYRELTFSDRLLFYATLENGIHSDHNSLQEYLLGSRFEKNVTCIHCKSSHIVKNGHRKDGVQRFLCRDCRRSFILSTDSVITGTHKDISVWVKYLECMFRKHTLREAAYICRISMGTAFAWRHKLLSALRPSADKVRIYGEAEADETYFSISYKGNHGRSGKFSMPRKAHKRGGEIHAKGLSSEKACVLCAVSSSGLPVCSPVKAGKISSDAVELFFTGRILRGTLLSTDNERAYRRFSSRNGVNLVQTDTGCRTKGSYGIQRVSSYHSRLKGFIRHFKGVATKYLEDYLVWYNVMFCSGNGQEECGRLITGMVLAERMRIRNADISQRPLFPARGAAA